MKAITMIAAILGLFTTSTIAQLNFNPESLPTDKQEIVEVLIVRNAEECLGYESSIYELIDGERQKIAFLYHESDMKNAAGNFYNLNAIREVLTGFEEKGYQVDEKEAHRKEQRCNREIKYTLVKDLALEAE